MVILHVLGSIPNGGGTGVLRIFVHFLKAGVRMV